jgi:hypothetical protein
MTSKTTLATMLVLALTATDCAEDSDADGDGTDGSAENGDDDGGHDCTPNDSDGMTQCTNQLCSPTQYCEPVNGLCSNGCESTLNCAPGDYCDKRMPTDNLDGTLEIGICRTPGAECNVDDGSDEHADDAPDDTTDPDTGGPETGSPACSEWQGNYAVTLDADSPDLCNEAFSGESMCSVTQDECTLHWGCDGNFGVGFPDGPVDGDGEYQGSGSFMGVPFDCTIQFFAAASYSFTWECSANPGMPVLCTGLGF